MARYEDLFPTPMARQYPIATQPLPTRDHVIAVDVQDGETKLSLGVDCVIYALKIAEFDVYDTAPDDPILELRVDKAARAIAPLCLCYHDGWRLEARVALDRRDEAAIVINAKGKIKGKMFVYFTEMIPE